MRFIVILLCFLCFVTPIYSRETITLSKSNTLFFNKEFNELFVTKVMVQAYLLDKQLKPGLPIYLVLDTPGGSVNYGMQLIAVLRSFERPIHTISLRAASMGFISVQYLGKRYVVEQSVLMSHRARVGVEVKLPEKSNSLKDFHEQAAKDINKIIVARANNKISLAEYEKKISNDWYMTGQQAIKYGLADEMVNVRCDLSLMGLHKERRVIHDEVVSDLVEVESTVLDCPLMRGALQVEVIKDCPRLPTMPTSNLEQQETQPSNIPNPDTNPGLGEKKSPDDEK